mgnify:CR=1 FL=1
MKITVKKLADLRKPAHNIRRHSDKQITEYIRSIEMFGQIKPLVVDEHGEIIAGNGLFEALTRMGRETCDCYVVTGLTDVQKKKLMMADNKVYELGFTDTDAIEQLVKELDGDTDVPGWDADLLKMLDSTIEEADEIVNDYGSRHRSGEHESPPGGGAHSVCGRTQLSRGTARGRNAVCTCSARRAAARCRLRRYRGIDIYPAGQPRTAAPERR